MLYLKNNSSLPVLLPFAIIYALEVIYVYHVCAVEILHNGALLPIYSNL